MLLTPEFKDVWDYWHSIRGDKLIPNKKDFDPMKIVRDLGGISLLAWKNGEWINRIVGGKIVDDIGVDFSGHKLYQKTSSGIQDFGRKHLGNIMNHPAGWQGVFVEREVSGLLRESCVLCLPVEVDNDRNNQIISVRKLASDEVIGIDSAYPELVVLGINHMSFIDLGAGLPAIDPDECTASTACQVRAKL